MVVGSPLYVLVISHQYFHVQIFVIFVLQVVEAVPTRYRSERESVPKYLFSRSVAGTSHRDLIDSVDRLYNGQIYARFFPMFPPRKFNLSRWLRDWINVGAIPVATLNLQKGPVRPGQTIPDAWHHQVKILFFAGYRH